MGRIKDASIAEYEPQQFDAHEGINIGSGPHYAAGWWNTDVIPTDSGQQPDQLIDIRDFTAAFPKHAFRKAYVGHVLEHITWDDLPSIIQHIAHVAKRVMVVGPCIEKAIATKQPQAILDAITAVEIPDTHPWGHKWTPSEELTIKAITDAGFTPHVVRVQDVRPPEWPNPSIAEWQTAMWFETGGTK